MSKVKISGHSSGTGTVTITAPNTNSDRTLTIPDITGTALTSADTGTVTQAIIHPDAVNRFISGRKNLIINGGFDVWQRGTSNTNYTGFTSDRWWGRCSLGTHEKVSRSGTTPNYMKVTKAGDDIDPFFNTKVEDGSSIYAGKTLTLSFSYKHLSGSTDTFQNSIGLYVNHSLGNTSLSGSLPATYETLNNGWVRYKYTFTLPTSATGYLTVGFEFNQNNGVTYSLGITGVQLELGSVATDFEHRSYGEELALCQRYYQKIPADGFNGLTRAESPMFSNSDRISIPLLPVTMRDRPSVVAYSVTGTANILTEFSSAIERTVNAVYQEGVSGGGYAQLSASATNPVYLNMTFDAEV